MKKKILLALIIILGMNAFSQTEKFDIATFVPPAGWQRDDSNGNVVYRDLKTNNNNTTFCQLIIFPSRASNKNAETNFNDEWNNRVVSTTGAKEIPQIQKEQTPDGWTAVIGTANITVKQMTSGCMLVSSSGFGRVMSILINTTGGDYVTQVESFLKNFEMDGKAATAMNAAEASALGTAGFNNYSYIPPQGWQVQNKKEYIQFQNIGSGCLIQVFMPQPSTGNLEQDVAAVFDKMYKGWQFQRTGERKFDLSKGFLPKGFEYCKMEASMSMTGTDGRYHLEEGAALLVKAGNQNVIISVRHNASMMEHDDCWKKYETCGRFFNSFTVNNVPIPNPSEEENTKRIVGVWKLTGHGVAAGDYIFAANGSYQFGGAIGTSTTTSDFRYEYLHITSYAWQGDGNYIITGDQLTLKKRGSDLEQVQFRFEKVNHGGTGWKDRLYLLKTGPTLGKKYEVCYEKSDPEKN